MRGIHGRKIAVVNCQEQACPLSHFLVQHGKEFHAPRHIQRAGWLIKQKERPWASLHLGQSPGQKHTLPFAAGKCAQIPLFQIAAIGIYKSLLHAGVIAGAIKARP